MEFEEDARPLYSKVLEKDMNGKEILEELKPTEVTLGRMFSYLSQADKQDYMIFYIRDESGLLRTVVVDWYGVGWDIFAYSVEDPDVCDVGNRVFSASPFENQTSSLSGSLTLEQAIGICVMNGYEVKKLK